MPQSICRAFVPSYGRRRMNKKLLTEADIRTKFITPAIVGENSDKWDLLAQIREECYFTKGRVIVQGKTVKRGKAHKADYILARTPIALLLRVDCDMKWEAFKKWFNRSFWRAFQGSRFPIEIPVSAEDKEKTVRKVFEAILSARYAASIPEAEIVINKGHGVARTTPVFRIEDYIVYYFCIKELEQVLCINRTPNTFGGWSLGGQLRSLEDREIEIDAGTYTSRYSFNPRAWTAAFGEFNSLLFAQLDNDVHTHVLQFDLSNFYDCVRLDILERWIREESDAAKGWIIALLFYFLNQWNRKNTGLHPQAVGLPQDALADCSRILANFYLQKYDSYAYQVCEKAGAAYFRYADDQMILLKDPSAADQLMLLLTRNLDKYGLRVNQKKVDLWTKEQLLEHRCRDIQAVFKEKGDAQDRRKVRKFAKAYLGISNRKLANSWNGGLPLLNRLLWANLESLPEETFEKLMKRYTSKDYLLRADFEKLKRVSELNKRLKQPVNLSKRLWSLGKKSVHNAFNYEVLTFAQSQNLKLLAKQCEQRIQDIGLLMEHNEVS
jgi:hypothetical protein